MIDRLYDIADTFFPYELPGDKNDAIQEIKDALQNSPECIINMLLDIIDDLQ